MNKDQDTFPIREIHGYVYENGSHLRYWNHDNKMGNLHNQLQYAVKERRTTTLAEALCLVLSTIYIL